MSSYDPEYYRKNRDSIIESQKKYREKNREKLRKKAKENYKKNKDRLNENKKKYYKENPDKKKAKYEKAKQYRMNNLEKISEIQKEYREKNKEKLISYSTVWRRKLTTRVKENLGGACACCGESEFEFLTVDHIHNDGSLVPKQKNKSRNGYSYYGEIDRAFKSSDQEKIEYIKSRYQILCSNCNLSKHIGNGVCAHKRNKKESKVKEEMAFV